MKFSFKCNIECFGTLEAISKDDAIYQINRLMESIQANTEMKIIDLKDVSK